MKIQIIDPLSDPRWSGFVQSHPCASVFHSKGWLAALQKTYSFEPQAICGVDGSYELRDSLVFCLVKSWFTGSRLVSLPFSDHCEPLVDSELSLVNILSRMEEMSARRKCGHIEIRPLNLLQTDPPGWSAGERFCMHTLSLEPSLNTILAGTHRDCVQRKIRRAEREGMVIHSGRSEEFLQEFYPLMIQTRRRHGSVPQPLSWFRNLAACMEDSFVVYVARYRDQPVAAMVTLAFQDRVTYKYGASDVRYHQLGAMPALFWRVIADHKSAGYRVLDLGRSDLDNLGLISFKDRLGAIRSKLSYWHYPNTRQYARSFRKDHSMRKWILRSAPDALLAGAGGLLYRHFG